jgi:hypothetical protein
MNERNDMIEVLYEGVGSNGAYQILKGMLMNDPDTFKLTRTKINKRSATRDRRESFYCSKNCGRRSGPQDRRKG